MRFYRTKLSRILENCPIEVFNRKRNNTKRWPATKSLTENTKSIRIVQHQPKRLVCRHLLIISQRHSSFYTSYHCRRYMGHYGRHPAASLLASASLVRRLPSDSQLGLSPPLDARGYCEFPPS